MTEKKCLTNIPGMCYNTITGWGKPHWGRGGGVWLKGYKMVTKFFLKKLKKSVDFSGVRCYNKDTPEGKGVNKWITGPSMWRWLSAHAMSRPRPPMLFGIVTGMQESARCATARLSPAAISMSSMSSARCSRARTWPSKTPSFWIAWEQKIQKKKQKKYLTFPSKSVIIKAQKARGRQPERNRLTHESR